MSSDKKHAPTMAEECYIISRKKYRHPKLSLQKRLQKLENRIDMLDDMLGDDITELRCEIDDIKKILSAKNKYNTSSDSSD